MLWGENAGQGQLMCFEETMHGGYYIPYDVFLKGAYAYLIQKDFKPHQRFQIQIMGQGIRTCGAAVSWCPTLNEGTRFVLGQGCMRWFLN